MSLVLKSVTYFDVDELKFKFAKSIHINTGKIIEIDGVIDNDDEIIDCTDKFVIPGLIDTHIHFFQSGGLFTRPDGLDLRHIKSYEQEFEDIKNSIPKLFKRYLATGVTSIVDCGGPFWNFDVKSKSEELLSPNVEVAGPLVSTVKREKLDLGDPPIIKANNEDHARQLVQNCIEYDPVFVKLWFIYQENNFEKDSKIMEAAIKETHKLGYRVAVHATELKTAKKALKFGADILVHSVFDELIDDEFIELCRVNDTIYIPTLMVRYGYRDVYRTRHRPSMFEQIWGDSEVINSWNRLIELEEEQIPESHRDMRNEYNDEPEEVNQNSFRSLKKLADANVIIAAGTDAGNVGTLHGPAIHKELELMSSTGMTAARVLKSATLDAAKVMSYLNLGKIEENYLADLLILEKNPIDDIKNTRSISKVIKSGEVYNPDDLVEKTIPADIVDNQVEAYNNRDIDKFLSYYHPRIKIYDLETNNLRMKGLDELRVRYTELFEESPNLNAEIKERITKGSMVIDHELVSGFRGDNTVEAIAQYKVQNHLITDVWFS